MRAPALGPLLALCLVGCGSSVADTAETPPPGGGGAGGQAAGGATGSAGSPAVVSCSAGIPMLVVPFDPQLQCLDTTSPTVVGCRAGGYGDYYPCFRRLSDGREYWSADVSLLTVDPAEWEACPGPKASQPPRPCFGLTCESAPVTSCELTFAREWYGCGAPTSEWDEGCCRRRPCSPEAPCASDEDCVSIPTFTYQDCWAMSVAPYCDCASTPGGLTKDVCIKRAE